MQVQLSPPKIKKNVFLVISLAYSFPKTFRDAPLIFPESNTILLYTDCKNYLMYLTHTHDYNYALFTQPKAESLFTCSSSWPLSWCWSVLSRRIRCISSLLYVLLAWDRSPNLHVPCETDLCATQQVRQMRWVEWCECIIVHTRSRIVMRRI